MNTKTASLYIHIPFCAHRCAYCDFFSTVPESENQYAPYVNALIKDILFFKSLYSIDAFPTVYIGGGTPSLFPLPLIKDLASFINSNQTQAIEEFTIEANPQDITFEHLQTWQECGINRLSLGIQSLQDDVLKNEKRRGSRNESITTLKLVKNKWKGLLSLDFIAGLKGQTCENLSSDLSLALQFEPHHISLYELVPHDNEMNSSFSQINERKKTRELLWTCGAELLQNNGYIQYEISSFSKRNAFSCIHNKAYWKMSDYVGVGAGAVGTVKIAKQNRQELIDIQSRRKLIASYPLQNQGEEQDLSNIQNLKAIRSFGVQDVSSYINQENRSKAYSWENVKAKDLLKDSLLMGFRLMEGIDDAEFKANFATSLFDLIPQTISKWERIHLLCVEISQSSAQKLKRLKLTKKGSMLLNAFLCDAFAEIDENAYCEN